MDYRFVIYAENGFYVLSSTDVITAMARLSYYWRSNLSSGNIPLKKALYLNLPTLTQFVGASFFSFKALKRPISWRFYAATVQQRSTASLTHHTVCLA